MSLFVNIIIFTVKEVEFNIQVIDSILSQAYIICSPKIVDDKVI
jgi:hypothetical protein